MHGNEALTNLAKISHTLMKVGLQYALYRNVNDVVKEGVSEKKYNIQQNYFSCKDAAQLCKGASFRDSDV